jgi:hypothetical protein
MKVLSIIFTLLIAISGKSQNINAITEAEDWAMQMSTPSRDSLDKYCALEIKYIERRQKNNLNECDLYYLNERLYSGWACAIIAGNRHKYRYEQFDSGKMIRRIAYYDNGQVDADFRMKSCKNYGPSRMWLYDGKMYIDEFYISPGVKHGIQKQWHDNGVLARESKFEKGKLLFEKRFDRNGKEISQTN